MACNSQIVPCTCWLATAAAATAAGVPVLLGAMLGCAAALAGVTCGHGTQDWHCQSL